MARNLAPESCLECPAKLRPFDAKATDWPNTRRHAGKGLCSRCYSRTRYANGRSKQVKNKQPIGTQSWAEYPKPCANSECRNMMRPRTREVSDYDIPTVVHRGLGYCAKCYKSIGRRSEQGSFWADLLDAAKHEEKDWRDYAACIGKNPRLWDGDIAVGSAKEICKTCPVRNSCLIQSYKEDGVGIWGGLTEKERHIIRKEVKIA